MFFVNFLSQAFSKAIESLIARRNQVLRHNDLTSVFPSNNSKSIWHCRGWL